MGAIDKAEDGVLTGAGLIVGGLVCVIALMIYSALKGIQIPGLPDLSKLKNLLTWLANLNLASEDFLYKVRDAVTKEPGDISGYGPDVVRTGIVNQDPLPDDGAMARQSEAAISADFPGATYAGDGQDTGGN